MLSVASLLLALPGCATSGSFEDGFASGYETGYSDALSAVPEGGSYDNGYDDGYSDGYTLGYDEGCADSEAFYNEGYLAGYNAAMAEIEAFTPSENLFETPSTMPSQSTNVIVYITSSGTKYHVSGCSYRSTSSISISLSDALSKGYAPCSRCHPPTE